MTVASVTVVATSAAIAGKEKSARAHAVTASVPGSAQAISLAPALVVATRPTLSEVLDLVLHERPTAAELSSLGSGERGFPAGSDEARIAGILRRYSKDEPRLDRIASALVKESRRRKVGSSLLVGVLLTENPDLDPRATSSVGARGLMQVMPFHAGKWGCPSSDLFDIESNICHGVAILADNLAGARNLPQALLGYNGCVRGTNTPGCFRYPSVVYRHARSGADSGGGKGQPFSRKGTLAP